jgi:nucleotide-binding universal stress UspA family protein
MKTIFVPVSGTETDRGVFATALWLARSLPGAHMEFYHLRQDPCESALRDPHASFCIGAGIGATLSYFEVRDKALAAEAVHHFQDFCKAHAIPILESPLVGADLSAEWLEETNYPEERFLLHARHTDITVLGRKHTVDLMPEGMTGQLLRESGRPVVIASDVPPAGPMRTILIGWKETAECARALTAAMPLLRQAERVLLVSVNRETARTRAALMSVACQLTWNQVKTEVMPLPPSGQAVAQQLIDVATAERADLVVVGGYGHTAVREHYFGGVTRDLLRAANLPVFLMH